MNFMRSRRPSLADMLQRMYDEAYQSSVHAILLETQNDQQSALRAWKSTLEVISRSLSELESTPPKTPTEQSYMSSVLDIERQCHDRISYLEYRQYNNSPYGYLPQVQTGQSILDMPSFEGSYHQHQNSGSSNNYHARNSSSGSGNSGDIFRSQPLTAGSSNNAPSSYNTPYSSTQPSSFHTPYSATQPSSNFSIPHSSNAHNQAQPPPPPPPRQQKDSYHHHSNSLSPPTVETTMFKSESAIRPEQRMTRTGSSDSIQSRSHSTTSIDTSSNKKPMIKTLRKAKPGKISNGTKVPAASKAASLAWRPGSGSNQQDQQQEQPVAYGARSSSSIRSQGSSSGFEKLSLRGKQGGFNKLHNESRVDPRSRGSASSGTSRPKPTPQQPVSRLQASSAPNVDSSQPPLIDLREATPPPPPHAPGTVTSTPATPPAGQSSPSSTANRGANLGRPSTVYMANRMRRPQSASGPASTSERLPALSSSKPQPPPKPKALSPNPSPSSTPVPKSNSAPKQSSNPKLRQSAAASKPKVKEPVLADNEENSSKDTQLQSTGDSDWDKRCKQVMKNLRGVDENAAKQILNDIVVKGDEVHWDDIAGLEQAKNSLKEAVVYPFLRPDLFSGLREPARGMLLFGPPGTGKTMLARAVATESHSTFFSISASSLTSKFLGDSEKLVRALFYLAKQFAPSIIFVDEIDSLLSTRSESGEHEASRRIKTEFLVQWSDLQRAAAGNESDEDVQRVLVLAATNLPWAIDEAARRRFVRRQYIPLPERETRYYQLRKLLSHQKHALTDTDIGNLLQMTEGFSGSDITALAKDAAMGPLRSLGEALLTTPRESIRPIALEDFESSLRFIRPSVSREGLAEFEDWASKYGSSGA